MRTFAGKVATLAVLVGFALVVLLASVCYALVATIRVGNEATSTYADELILAWSLQEAHERKLASGRGVLLSRDETLTHEFDKASTDTEAILTELRADVTSTEGIALLDESARTLSSHDQALREVMAMNAEAETTAQAWATRVMPKATRARHAMDAFIHYKQKLREQANARVSRAQRRAAWAIGGTTLAALLVALLGGGRLLRSAQGAYAAEKRARMAAERERIFFYSLLDQLPMGIVAANPSGTILHVSGFARRMLEEEEEEEKLPGVAAKVVGDLATWPMFRADRASNSAENFPLARALRGEVVTQDEVQSRSERVYSVTAGPIRDENGIIIAAVAAFIDVSERRRAKKERELFIGALGHDLRNPLNAISIAAESLLQRDDVPDAARKPAARIASSADRMNRLIGDLLDFARSQHGAIRIKPEDCELHVIAAEVIAEIRIAQPDRDILVEAQEGCDGRWDRARLAQVFQNLLGNAVEHGKPDAPITVRTGCDHKHVWAKVTNRGAIPPEERPRIFEPFRSSSTSKGLGLGLYIARAIVEAHGGTIAVDCKDDETTFLINLPLHVRAHSEEQQPSA
jgi:signal transduction histidine kinase